MKYIFPSLCESVSAWDQLATERLNHKTALSFLHDKYSMEVPGGRHTSPKQRGTSHTKRKAMIRLENKTKDKKQRRIWLTVL